jgi:hypothetical protein
MFQTTRSESGLSTSQASNASATMISDIFSDVFIPPMIAADRGGDHRWRDPEMALLG